MSNLYYSSPTDVEPSTKARSIDINSIDSAVDAAFDKLPTETNLKQGKVNYAVTGGSADAYTVSLPHAPASYTDGLLVEAYIHATNTGASTVNVNSLGVKSIKLQNGDNPAAGDLQKFVTMRYSTTTGFFHVQANSAAAAAAAAASAVTAAGHATTAGTQATNSSTSATNSAASATLASQWATTTGALVASTDYSSKEYAIGTTVTSGSSKDWAQKTSAAVTGTSYSAKEWALGTLTRGAASGGSAKDWATYTGGTVDDTEYSAKYYANLASGYTLPFSDATALIKNGTDATKKAIFSAASISTGTTRTYTLKDANGTLAFTSDITGTNSGTNTGDQNVFSTVAVSGQSNIVADSTSDTLTLAAGTGITLTTDAATDTVTIAATTAPALVFLSSVTASASATADIETTFDSTYDSYLIIGTAIKPADDNVSLRLRMKVGGAYDTGSNYNYHATNLSSASSSYAAAQNAAVAHIIVANTVGNDTGEHCNVMIRVFAPANTGVKKMVLFESCSVDGSGNARAMHGAGNNTATTALTGIRLYFETGNIASGTFRLYGIKNS